MKLIFTFAVLLLTGMTGYAKGLHPTFTEDADGSISGIVLDSATNQPVEYATVALMDETSDKPVNGAVCDEKGKFEIKKVPAGKYRVVVSFIGYSSKTIRVTVGSGNNNINLGAIKISDSSSILKEVTIEAEKPLIEERVDRMIYNAENDATAKGGDAADILRRVPMLTVDMDGNVSLRGNQNIQVLINNKPSTIVASSVSDALKQIPADQIKSVEVITSPSAKYDAEGSAGIINIITKKNTLQGLTLNVDAGVGLRGSNLGLNGNYRRKNMGFSLGGWGRANYNVTGESYNRSVYPDGREQIQTAETNNQGLFGNYNLGWDYDINDKNFLAASVRFGLRGMERKQDNFRFDEYLDDVLQRSSLSRIKNKDRSNSVDASLTYTHLYDVKGRELSFQGQYSRNNNSSYFLNELISGTGASLENDNDSHNQEMTLQVDYATPLGTNQILEFGAKDIIRKVNSDVVGGNIPSNNLNYEQNVMSGYLAYTLNLASGYSVKAGSRYEYTMIDAYTLADNEGSFIKKNIEIPSYGVVVPSVNLSKKLKKGNTIKFSYNRRIQRPSIRYLNPNRQSQNNNNFTEGNPALDPEYTNNYEIGYSAYIKGTSLNFTAFARNTNDAIQSLREEVSLTDSPIPGETKAIRTTYANIGSESAYGTSIFASVNIGKLTLSGGGDVYYAVLDNNSPMEQYKASNEGLVVSGRVFGSYDLGKGYAAQFFGFGRGRSVQLQGYSGNFRMYNIGFRKDFNEKRGSVGIGIENFLQKALEMKGETVSPQVSQYYVNTMHNFSFRVTFSYRIGKMSMDARPNRRGRGGINNDDLKEAGDSGAGMDTGVGGGPGGGGGMTPQRSAGGFGGGGRIGQTPGAVANPNMVQADTAAVVDPVGTWNYKVESPQGGDGKLTIVKSDNGYSGTITNARFNQELPIKDVKLNGNELSFSYEVSFGGNSAQISVVGTINENDFNGTMAFGQFGSFPINAKRSE